MCSFFMLPMSREDGWEWAVLDEAFDLRYLSPPQAPPPAPSHQQQRAICPQCYGLIDTGLQYKETNPATGWVGERCVLTVRQRQSRLRCQESGL